MILCTRPIPLFAEAAILLSGLNRFPWATFLLVIATSNLAVATCFVALGHLATLQGWFWIALLGVVAFPLLSAIVARRWLESAEKLGNHDGRRHDQPQQQDGDGNLQT